MLKQFQKTAFTIPETSYEEFTVTYDDFEEGKLVKKHEVFNLPNEFKFVKYLGNGATSVVIEVEHKGKSYAIKKLLHCFEHPEYAKRTLRELKIQRKLHRHPNVSQAQLTFRSCNSKLLCHQLTSKALKNSTS